MAQVVDVVGARVDLCELSGCVGGRRLEDMPSLIGWKRIHSMPVVSAHQEELLDQGKFQPTLGIFHGPNVTIRRSHNLTCLPRRF